MNAPTERKPKPVKPGNISIEFAEAFVVFNKSKAGNEMIDVTEDAEGAKLIQAQFAGSFTEKRDVLIKVTKTGRGRGSKAKRAVYVLDPDCTHGEDFASSENAELAIARRSALAKLSDVERRALGLDESGQALTPIERAVQGKGKAKSGDAKADTPPRDPKAERGSVANPNSATDDPPDEDEDEDFEEDPFATDDDDE